jgi:hypothetical protein
VPDRLIGIAVVNELSVSVSEATDLIQDAADWESTLK